MGEPMLKRDDPANCHRRCRAGRLVARDTLCAKTRPRSYLVERYKFPRQKLCGEFHLAECLADFDELGVRDEMLAAGGDRVFETRFFEPGGRSVNIPTNWFGAGEFALSLSRARMDKILLDAAPPQRRRSSRRDEYHRP